MGIILYVYYRSIGKVTLIRSQVNTVLKNLKLILLLMGGSITSSLHSQWKQTNKQKTHKPDRDRDFLGWKSKALKTCLYILNICTSDLRVQSFNR